MTLDLVLLCLAALFAVLGAISGAARQLAQLAGLVVAYLSARPLGALLGPPAAELLGIPPLAGLLLSTVAVFFVALTVVRFALGWFLRRLLAGGDPEDRKVDRLLGAGLGALKIIAIAYVVLCALTFVEDNVVIGGKRLSLSPKGSHAVATAREFNLFELTQFSSVKDLARLAEATSDPARAERLHASPEFKALQKDPRFQRALNEPAVRQALESGDYRSILQSAAVMQLVQDPAFKTKLEAAAQAAQKGRMR